jgi:hypothetical protein
MKIKAPKDFWAGLMFIGFGVGFAVVAQNYQMGTARISPPCSAACSRCSAW